MPFNYYKIKWTRNNGGADVTVATLKYPFPVFSSYKWKGDLSYSTWAELIADANGFMGGSLTMETYGAVNDSDLRDRMRTALIPVLPDWFVAGDKLWFDESRQIYMQVTAASGYSLEFAYYREGSRRLYTYGYSSDRSGNDIIYRSLPWVKTYTTPSSAALGLFTCYWNNSRQKFTSYENPWQILYKDNGNQASTTDFYDWLRGVDPIDLDDPYVDIPESSPSGPAEGSGIPTTAAVSIPDLPTVSVTDSGFIRLFNPSLGQVHDLASYMWSDSFDIATYKKLFADPMDCLLGFNMLPVSIPQGAAVAVKVGNISTGIQMYPATSQWVSLDCGSIQLDLPYGCYLDYSPYTKYSIYLPYIGTQELSADDVVGKNISLKYHIDILSCACVAYLKCGSDTLYQFSGACGYSIPMSGSDYRQMINSAIEITKSLGGAILSGGMTAPMAMKTVGSAVQNVMNSKPEVHRSGTIAGANGILGIQKPYLIVEYPNACKPEKQYHYTGFPSFVTVTVGDLLGYAEFEEIIVSGVPCTDEERKMIQAQCAGGIYL